MHTAFILDFQTWLLCKYNKYMKLWKMISHLWYYISVVLFEVFY